jgi:cell division protein ZapA (FtsZ GTPase activity inhibitor)
MTLMKKYTVSVFGEKYSLVTDEEETFFLSCVEFADSLMYSLARAKNHNEDSKKIAILAALHITLQLKNMQRRAVETEKTLNNLVNLLN